MRTTLALGTVALSVVALAATAAPANAATGTTTVGLTVLDGVLAIAATPAAGGVSSVIVSTSRETSSALGITTITDTRAASTGWTLTAATTAFTPFVAGTADIAASAAKFSLSEAPIKILGTATYTYTATPGSSGSLAVASATGMNTATVLPVLTLAIPNSAVTGVYNGTVTQSVV